MNPTRGLPLFPRAAVATIGATILREMALRKASCALQKVGRVGIHIRIKILVRIVTQFHAPRSITEPFPKLLCEKRLGRGDGPCFACGAYIGREHGHTARERFYDDKPVPFEVRGNEYEVRGSIVGSGLYRALEIDVVGYAECLCEPHEGLLLTSLTDDDKARGGGCALLERSQGELDIFLRLKARHHEELRAI